MSDDHYKNPHKPNQYGEEDDKTQLVDLNELQGGAPEPQFAPPPTMESSEATQLFEIPPSMGGFDNDGDGITSSAPDYGSAPYGQSAPPPQQNFGSQPVAPAPGGGFGAAPVQGNPGGSGQPQVVIGGGPGGGDNVHTQFVNIADFAQQKAHFTPEQQQAGYDGNTQFVDVNALMAGNQGGGGDPIDNDQELHRGYQFGPDNIQRGEVTIIHAQNPLGKMVILKRVWEGDPQQMSAPLRQRIAQLHELRHPNLVPMNGMFVSASGMWVELESPRGERLTNLLQNQGPQPAERVLPWMAAIADVLETIHSNQLAYANLTTDAVWIDPSGKVQIEPFDMLRLADRGNLGAFGPPEMNAPPEQRQLSPATDVFSLAAVTCAALTGLPFQIQNLAQFEDQKLAENIKAGLNIEAGQRPQSTKAFVDTLQGGGGLNLDIKVVGAAVAGLMVVSLLGLVVLLRVLGGGGGDPLPVEETAQSQQAVAETGQAAETGGDEVASGQDSDQGADSPRPASPDLPGDVAGDARVSVTHSFLQNPPETAVPLATDESLAQWRQRAQELIETGDSAPRSQRYEHYLEALELLTRVIRSQESAPDTDWQAWNELYEKPVVRQEVDQLQESLEEMYLEGRIGTARRRYDRLANIDPRANAQPFFSRHNSATIVEIRIETDEDSE